MMHSLVIISALTGMAVAQTSSISSLFLPQYVFDSQALVASIVTVAPMSAEFFVQCPPDMDANDCGLGPGVSVTMQPGTYAIGLNEPPDLTMSQRCVINQQTAVCTATILGSEANDPGVETVTMTDITTEDFFMPVTITAGLEKLAAATATGAAATGDSTATTAQTSDASSVTPSQTSGSSTEATGTAASTGAAAPHVTRDAVLAGAVALMGCALAL